jgi:hypothetical protein
MPQVTFDEVLEAIEHLPVDEQADLLEVVRRRLAERGRRRVIDDITEARTQFDSGMAKPASVDEIMHEIES